VQSANYTNPALLNLGLTSTYGVLASATITNSGATVINGDLGLYPGSAVTGAPQVLGKYLVTSPLADLAQGDLLVAIGDAANRTMDQWIAGDLGGLTLTPGVYRSSSTIGITDILYLDAQFDPDAAWVFQIATTADFQVGSSIVMLNRAKNTTLDNVFWNIGTVARIKTSAVVLGTVLSWQGVAVGLGAVTGPLFSKNAAVTLLGNTVTARVLPADNHRLLSFGDELSSAPVYPGSNAGEVALVAIALLLSVVAAGYYHVVLMNGVKGATSAVEKLLVETEGVDLMVGQNEVMTFQSMV
jgi:hypothetical protein